MIKEMSRAKSKNTLASGNVSNKKNLHPGGRKFFSTISLNLLNQVYTKRTTQTANEESYHLLFEEEKTSIRPNEFASRKPP